MLLQKELNQEKAVVYLKCCVVALLTFLWIAVCIMYGVKKKNKLNLNNSYLAVCFLMNHFPKKAI